MRMIAGLLLLLAAMLGTGAAGAATCAVSAGTSANLGSQPSYTVLGGTVPQINAPGGLACPGALVDVLSADYARATVTSANAFRLVDGAGNGIGYRMSADSAGKYGFGQGGSIDYLSPQVLSVLGLGSNDLSTTFYAKLTETPNLPAGTYSDTVTILWSWSICRGIGAAGVCLLLETGSGTTTTTVTLTVTKDCRITAPPLSFGTAALASQFGAVTQAVAIGCTKGAAYAVSFTSGGAGAARPWRTMTDGHGHILQYNLYRTDGVTIWDETNPLPATLPGTGAVTPDQLQTYVAKVNPSQSSPPVGTYTDTVSVVIAF